MARRDRPQHRGRRGPYLRRRLRDSVRHQEELKLAAAYQVPRSKLLGRPRRARTVYNYDESGRLASADTEWEPEWLDEDVDWGMAHQANEADKCRCGHPLSESTAMRDGDPVHSYLVDSPIRCHACDELAKKQEAHAEGEVVRPQALLWTVVKER